MTASALHQLALIAGQPWAWAPIIAAILARDTFRLVGFLWGLSIALRGTNSRDRAQVLTAYATCLNHKTPRGAPVTSRQVTPR